MLQVSYWGLGITKAEIRIEKAPMAKKNNGSSARNERFRHKTFNDPGLLGLG